MRHTTLVERIHRSLKLLRRTRIAQMLDQSPHMRLKKLLSQYALALHEEAQLLSHYRKHPRSTPARFMAEESREAWRRWRHLAKRIYDKIAALDSTMASWINRFTDKLEGFEKRHERLTGTLQSALIKLETRLGERVPDVMDHYLGRIRRRLERNRKWRADLEWLKIKNEMSERQRMRRKFDLERQILQENLKDLRQGVLWRWQD